MMSAPSLPPGFFQSQLEVKLPIPTHDFSGQTIIVTGSNIGLGLEAARHFVRLNAARVILAVRSTAKGEAAKRDIEASTGRSGVVEVKELDMASYRSVKMFAKWVDEEVERVDTVILNAGVALVDFEMAEQDERSITVNAVSTVLLAVLLLPVVRRSAQRFGGVGRIVTLSTGTHVSVASLQRKEGSVFEALKENTRTSMMGRYPVSKVILMLAMRELARKTRSNSTVIITIVNPGLCHSGLTRNLKGEAAAVMEARVAKYARTTEEGSRTLVHAAVVGNEAHGKYLDDCQVRDDAMSEFVRSEDGEQAQFQIWKELEQKIDAIQPGTMAQVFQEG